MTRPSIKKSRIFNTLMNSESITESVRNLCDSGDFDWKSADKYVKEILGKYCECMEADSEKRENLFHLVVASSVMSHMLFAGLREELDRTPDGENLKLVADNLPGMIYEQSGVLVSDMMGSMIEDYLSKRQDTAMSKKGSLN